MFCLVFKFKIIEKINIYCIIEKLNNRLKLNILLYKNNCTQERINSYYVRIISDYVFFCW